MKIIKFKILFVLPLFFVLCSMFLSEASAQTLSLSIYPPLLEVMIKPGKSITQVYKLINEGETDLVVSSSIVPFEPADELGNVKLETGLAPRLGPRGNPKLEIIKDWFSFQNADLQLGQRFVIKQGQTQQIVLAIKTPNMAQEDDYYLTLLFETTAPAEAFGEGGTATRAQAKIGANILLTISETGEPPRKAEIVGFKIYDLRFKIIDSFTKPQFVLRVENTGRSFFKPMGTITTTGWLGQKYLLNLLPENILVKSTRQVQCGEEDKIGPCQIKPKFLLGFYQTQVEFGLDKISSDYTAKINFIALPIKLISGVLILVILFIIIKKIRETRLKIPLDK